MKVEVKKPLKNLTLDVRVIRDIPIVNEEEIKILLTEAKKRLEQEGLRVVRGPFGSLQPLPRKKTKVDFIIRALVVPSAA